MARVADNFVKDPPVSPYGGAPSVAGCSKVSLPSPALQSQQIVIWLCVQRDPSHRDRWWPCGDLGTGGLIVEAESVMVVSEEADLSVCGVSIDVTCWMVICCKTTFLLLVLCQFVAELVI